MRALEITWEIFFCSSSSLFQIFLCEVSGRCVLGRPNDAPVCPDGDSGCLNDTVDSSEHQFF
jgi:hypothetical protein